MGNKISVLPKEPPLDDFSIRCPRLGHQISFSYCEKESSGLPCFKTLDCWHTHFDVQNFFVNKLSHNDFKKVFISKAQPKVLSLLDLIEKAKKKANKN